MLNGAHVVATAEGVIAAYHQLDMTTEQYFDTVEFFIDVLHFMRMEGATVVAIGEVLAGVHDQAEEEGTMLSDYWPASA